MDGNSMPGLANKAILWDDRDWKKSGMKPNTQERERRREAAWRKAREDRTQTLERKGSNRREVSGMHATTTTQFENLEGPARTPGRS